MDRVVVVMVAASWPMQMHRRRSATIVPAAARASVGSRKAGTSQCKSGNECHKSLFVVRFLTVLFLP